MLRRLYFLAGFFTFLFATLSWGAETITYVRKVSTTDFLGWGQVGFYFPQFDASGIVGPKRTEDSMQFSMPNWLEFQFNEADNKRTFSVDADFFDCDPAPPACAGRGVYTRGGYATWDSFTLPNGLSGRSGSIVDEHAAGNANNSVNRIHMKSGVPSSFCMHVVTDNTANSHNSAAEIAIRGGRDGQGSFDPNADIPDLSFDGTTDVHTFRFDNFLPNDFIKIRLNSGSGSMNPGFGGLMFDMSCDSIPGGRCGDTLCNPILGETCETCPGDCGACVPGMVSMGNWRHHGVDPQSHYQDGSNRLLIFAVHGVDNNTHWVQNVTYGNKRMSPLLSRDQNRNQRASVSLWARIQPLGVFTGAVTEPSGSS